MARKGGGEVMEGVDDGYPYLYSVMCIRNGENDNSFYLVYSCLSIARVIQNANVFLFYIAAAHPKRHCNY